MKLSNIGNTESKKRASYSVERQYQLGNIYVSNLTDGKNVGNRGIKNFNIQHMSFLQHNEHPTNSGIA